MNQLYQLLEHSGRPIPKAPTHSILVDVLNRDLTIKRISIYFNPEDSWGDDAPCVPDNAHNISLLIGRNLKFIGIDTMAVAFKYWATEISSQKIIYTSGVNFFQLV